MFKNWGLGVFSVFLFLAGCTGSVESSKKEATEQKAAAKLPAIQILDQMGDPSFIMNGVRVAEVNGEKCIIFVGMGAAEDQQAAVATSLMAVITIQVEKAKDRSGISSNSKDGEGLIKGLISSVSLRINVTGMFPLKHYYRFVKKPDYVSPFYEWFSEYAVNYYTYKNLRNEALINVKNEYQKKKQPAFSKQIEQLLKELVKLDNEPDGGL